MEQKRSVKTEDISLGKSEFLRLFKVMNEEHLIDLPLRHSRSLKEKMSDEKAQLFAKLYSALRKSWSKETAHINAQDKWNPANPALGQCAATALVVQDCFGGEIVYCKHEGHYWNRLPDGTEIDLTRSQFLKRIPLCCDGADERGYILEGGTPLKRYELLKKRVEECLMQSGGTACLTYRREEVKRARVWHMTNARLWAADPDINTMSTFVEGNILDEGRTDLLGLHEQLYWEREFLRDRLNAKFKEKKFIRIKDPDLQSFFMMYGLGFARYSLKLDDYCNDIARTAKNQFEELDMASPKEGSTDLIYNFKKDGLEIKLEIPPYAEGTLHYLEVCYGGELVFESEYRGEDENDIPILLVKEYTPGKWEREVREISKRIEH